MIRSSTNINTLKSGGSSEAFKTASASRAFRAHCPEDKKFKINDLLAFQRGRGDLAFSVLVLMVALFFLVAFWTETGWDKRKLPDDMLTYLGRQFGLIDGEGRLDRFGKILKQSWVAPVLCLSILIPAALLNLRISLRVHKWRKRFLQPTDMGYEVTQWLRALEFVGWFIAYTIVVPILGYLVATMILGIALPWRLGYRGRRWLAICTAASFAIVLVFRTGLQIKTPVNVWLYDFLPQRWESFMQQWF